MHNSKMLLNISTKRMNYTLSKIAEVTKGRLIGEDRTINSVSTDSRSINNPQNSLFVALKGSKRDGHDYIDTAAKKGVVAFLVSDLPENWSKLGSFIIVHDTLDALQNWAAYHRNQYRGELVAITGSNGKTVVKEWFAQLWDRERCGKLLRSPRSYNSQIGVALSLLMIEGDEKLVVIEAGISKNGEMERLEKMIQPTVGVLTNIADAHSENFNSDSDKLNEKLKLFYRCSPDRVIRGDKENFSSIEEHNKWLVEQIFQVLEFKPLTECDVLPLSLRLEVQQGVYNSTIINDSYSNDLASLRAALDFARRNSRSKTLTLILTDIEQNAMQPRELYQEVARLVGEYGVKSLVGIGNELKLHSDYFNGIASSFYSTTEAFLDSLEPSHFAASTLLIKGARSFRTERISNRLEERTHTTTLEVNLSRMVERLKYYQEITGDQCQIMAMVKASSYGMGSVTIARTLIDAGAKYLAVAYADEGITLRKGGITASIVVLNSDPGSFSAMIASGLEPEIYSISALRNYISEVKKTGIENAPIHIKLDTGMHRLGFMDNQVEELCQMLNSTNAIKVATIFTHLAAADDSAEDEFTRSQISLFNKLSSTITQSIGYQPLLSIANSAATERFKEAHKDIVRIGIGLYEGISTLSTKITQIKNIAKGETIGYNRRTKAEQDMTIAILPIGYADGMDRGLSCRVGKVAIGGVLCDIVGNVCMDTTIVDITKIKDRTKEGERAIIFGEGAMSEKQIAELLSTISYEILTSISPRIKRLYTM